MKKSIALASGLVFAASGALAGGIAPAVVEVEPMAPIAPVIVDQGPSGSLAGLPGGALGVAGAVGGAAVLAALLLGGDDDDPSPSTSATSTQ